MRKIWLLPLLLILALPVAAQKKHKSEDVTPEGQRSASNAHSFMELFSKLERDWASAALKKDEVSLDAFLAPEFNERDANNPDRTITRLEWMKASLQDYRLDPLSIRSMSIRAFIASAVVSFVQKETTMPSDAGRCGNYFIVDVWVINHDKWQVASRTLSCATCKN